MEKAKKDYSYNGFKSKAEWHVFNHLTTDKKMYEMCIDFIKKFGKERGSRVLFDELIYMGITHTPEGFKYKETSVRNAFKKFGRVL